MFEVSRRIKKNGENHYYLKEHHNKIKTTLSEVSSRLKKHNLDLKFYERYIFEQNHTVAVSQKSNLQLLDYVENIIGNRSIIDEMVKHEQYYKSILGQKSLAEEELESMKYEISGLKEMYNKHLEFENLRGEINKSQVNLKRMENTLLRIEVDHLKEKITEIQNSINCVDQEMRYTKDSLKEVDELISNSKEKEVLLFEELSRNKIKIRSMNKKLAELEISINELSHDEKTIKILEGKIKDLKEKELIIERTTQVDIIDVEGISKSIELTSKKVKDSQKLKRFYALYNLIAEYEDKDELNSLDFLEKEYSTIESKIKEHLKTLEKDLLDMSSNTIKSDKLLESQDIICSQINSIQEKIFSTKKKLEEVKNNVKCIQPSDMASGFIRKYIEAVTILREKSCQVYGFLTELGYVIETHNIHAVNTAIGVYNLTHSVVVEDRKTANMVVHYFKKHRIGQISCLVISEATSKSTREKNSDPNTLSNYILVKDVKFKSTFENILGSWILARDKEAAIQMNQKSVTKRNIVTIKGEKFLSSGEISAIPSAFDWDAVLGLKKSLQSVYVDKIDDAFDSESVEFEQSKKELIQYKTDISSFEAQYELMQEDLENLTDSLARISHDKENLSLSISNHKSAILTLEAKKARIIQDIDGKKCDQLRTRKHMNAIKDFQELLSSQNELLNLFKLKKELEAAIKNKTAIEDNQLSQQSELKNIQRIIDRTNSKVKKLNAKLGEYNDISKQLDLCKTELKDYKKEEKQLRQHLKRNKKHLNDLSSQCEEHQTKLNYLKDKKRKYVESINAKNDSLVELQHKILPDLEEYMFEIYDVNIIKSQIKDVRSELDRMHEEAESLKISIDHEKVTRYINVEQAIVNKYDDIKRISDDLMTCSGDIKTLEEVRFQNLITAIEQINSKLSRIYHKLSVQGDCYISFSKDISVLFELGLSYNIRPDRHQWKTISELSGGQKSLASLALVLSINQVFPCPLIFIDEADASLDNDAVQRLAETITDMTKLENSPQLFIISHRPEFYDYFDQIIGVYRFNKSSHSVVLKIRDLFKSYY